MLFIFECLRIKVFCTIFFLFAAFSSSVDALADLVIVLKQFL